MREAIGATYIFAICLVFILLFTAYLAISVNYAKAFKIKSYIVGLIEEEKKIDGEIEEKIETYLTAQGYAAAGSCPQSVDGWELNPQHGCLGNAPSGKCGVCVYATDVDSEDLDDIDAEKKYYKVVAFWKFDLPILNIVLPPFEISGESKYVIGDQR
ncbi:MAG: hypothetical protein HFG33_02880 [Bacilli bacterium]|nr:hypothetical protein [Bacilli bacterium]